MFPGRTFFLSCNSTELHISADQNPKCVDFPRRSWLHISKRENPTHDADHFGRLWKTIFFELAFQFNSFVVPDPRL